MARLVELRKRAGLRHRYLSPVTPRWPSTRRGGPARRRTDSYLLALAAERGGRFVTFDRAVVLSAVPAATPANLMVL